MQDSPVHEIYLDHNSTAPIPAAVSDVMRPYLTEQFGNPSNHLTARGEVARKAIETARFEVSKLLDARADEIVFTSGGTESCFAALVGAARAHPEKKHLIISAVEHPAVYETAQLLSEMCGVEVSILSVDHDGAPDLEQLESLFRPDTLLVSVMLANNETGVLMPLDQIVQIARAKGVMVHTDAVQAVGKEKFSFSNLGVDLLSLSAHKFGGIKGSGALVVRRESRWAPVVKGGGQENGRRGGTESVPLIVAMGEAAEIKTLQQSQGMIDQLCSIRDYFETTLLERISDCHVNGGAAKRLCNTSSVRIGAISAHEVIAALALRGIIVSAGSACKTGTLAPSKVLKSMGLSTVDCLSTRRFSFGPEITRETALHVIDILSETVAYFRAETAETLSTHFVRGQPK